MDNIKVYEITKDVGGPSIKEMLPQLKKILRSNRLILWGDLNHEDLDIILDNLPYKGCTCLSFVDQPQKQNS